MGCPIRTSPDHVLFADPRSFSQLTASFFATGSLGILRSLFFSFSVSESLATFLSLHFSESQIILLVALKLQSLLLNEKTRFKKILINLLLVFFTSLSFSNLSMNFARMFAVHPRETVGYKKKTSGKHKDLCLVTDEPPGVDPASGHAPKRRCSSHTFRYGYLVTT